MVKLPERSNIHRARRVRWILLLEGSLTIVFTEEKVKWLFYYMNFVELVFEETYVASITKKRQWRCPLQAEFGAKQTGRCISTSDDVIRSSYRVIFFVQPRFKPMIIGEEENFHSCYNVYYYTLCIYYKSNHYAVYD